MAKFKRFENGSTKKKERRREDFDAFESHAKRTSRAEKYNQELMNKHRSKIKDYAYLDESEDI